MNPKSIKSVAARYRPESEDCYPMPCEDNDEFEASDDEWGEEDEKLAIGLVQPAKMESVTPANIQQHRSKGWSPNAQTSLLSGMQKSWSGPKLPIKAPSTPTKSPMSQAIFKASFDPEMIGAESHGALRNEKDEPYMDTNFSGQIFRELADRQSAGQLSDGNPIPDQRDPEPGRKGIKALTKTAGYTHYYEMTRSFTNQEWSKILSATKQIVAKAKKEKISLADGSGRAGTKPHIGPNEISLNGAGDEMYETFYLPKEDDGDFLLCKTEHKPYDAVVVSILAVCKKVAPGALDLSSDGGMGAIKKVLATKKTADLRLSSKDKYVIAAFTDGVKAASKKLSTDGKQLDGLWMGGNRIAYWKNGRIHLGPNAGRAIQTVQRALQKYAPRNDFAKAASQADLKKALRGVVEHVGRTQIKQGEEVTTLEDDNLDSLEGRGYEKAKDAFVRSVEKKLGRDIDLFYQGRGVWHLHQKVASAKTARLHKRHEKVLEKYLSGLGSRARVIQSYDDLPEPIQNALHKIKRGETLWSDVDRWLSDNNGFYAKWAVGKIALDKLPESTWKYFKKVPKTILVDIDKLIPSRARPKGIENANKFMLLAYQGEKDRRKPLDLQDNGDGTYTVLDGNSTYANAKHSKWKKLPGVVVKFSKQARTAVIKAQPNPTRVAYKHLKGQADKESDHITLIPAHGRDYSSKDRVIRDYRSGFDFEVDSPNSPLFEKNVTFHDVQHMPQVKEVRLKYKMGHFYVVLPNVVPDIK